MPLEYRLAQDSRDWTRLQCKFKSFALNHMGVCVYIYMYVYVYIYIYKYTYIQYTLLPYGFKYLLRKYLESGFGGQVLSQEVPGSRWM